MTPSSSPQSGITRVIDTHRHPFGDGSKRLARAGGYDPARPLPQAVGGNVLYAEWLDEQTTVAGQRAGGVSRAILSNGGEVEMMTQLAGGDQDTALRLLLDDKLQLIERYPNDFDLMADANPFDESCRSAVEEALTKHGAKAISIATSWGNGAQRRFLDDPACEWLWDLADRRQVVIHLHPPMAPIGSEVQLPYRLMEVAGRPFDTAMTIARMIYSGTFDRYPALKVIVVHTAGAIPALIGRLEFGWRLNFHGVADRQAVAALEDRNRLRPSEYLRQNVWADVMGLSASCTRHVIELFGIDRILFGTDYGPVPISPREHIDMVLSLGLSDEDQEKIFWRNADDLLKLGL
jgi:predicted TIM-barrel fold metal-dependent hydrolase